MSRDAAWKGVLALAAVLAVGFAVRQGVRFSRVEKATQPAPVVEMMCSSCGAETSSKVDAMPMVCVSCGERGVELAAHCRACKKTLPMLDSTAYLASSSGAMGRAEEVFPKCPGCERLMVPKMLLGDDVGTDSSP